VKIVDDGARAATYRGAKYGAISGFIATWSVSAAMVIAEQVAGLQITLFYSIVGISLGANDVILATYIGFSLHIVVGTILGTLVGAIIYKWGFRIPALIRYKGTLLGIGIGCIVWLVFFLPTTILLIEPTLTKIASLSESQNRISYNLDEFIFNVMVSAIGFHILWGGIVGFLSIKIYEITNRHRHTNTGYV
jgi:hypothetical protein